MVFAHMLAPTTVRHHDSLPTHRTLRGLHQRRRAIRRAGANWNVVVRHGALPYASRDGEPWRLAVATPYGADGHGVRRQRMGKRATAAGRNRRFDGSGHQRDKSVGARDA